MATKSINCKSDEKQKFDEKHDIIYRLTANGEDAAKEESAEILATIDSLSDNDLEIVVTEHINL